MSKEEFKDEEFLNILYKKFNMPEEFKNKPFITYRLTPFPSDADIRSLVDDKDHYLLRTGMSKEEEENE